MHIDSNILVNLPVSLTSNNSRTAMEVIEVSAASQSINISVQTLKTFPAQYAMESECYMAGFAISHIDNHDSYTEMVAGCNPTHVRLSFYVIRLPIRVSYYVHAFNRFVGVSASLTLQTSFCAHLYIQPTLVSSVDRPWPSATYYIRRDTMHGNLYRYQSIKFLAYNTRSQIYKMNLNRYLSFTLWSLYVMKRTCIVFMLQFPHSQAYESQAYYIQVYQCTEQETNANRNSFQSLVYQCEMA